MSQVDHQNKVLPTVLLTLFLGIVHPKKKRSSGHKKYVARLTFIVFFPPILWKSMMSIHW